MKGENLYLHQADRSVEVMLIKLMRKCMLRSSTVGCTAITITHSLFYGIVAHLQGTRSVNRTPALQCCY